MCLRFDLFPFPASLGTSGPLLGGLLVLRHGLLRRLLGLLLNGALLSSNRDGQAYKGTHGNYEQWHTWYATKRGAYLGALPFYFSLLLALARTPVPLRLLDRARGRLLLLPCLLFLVCAPLLERRGDLHTKECK
jgi:hypothetical protein